MMSKYEQIYTEISKSIDNKQLKEGCKIPSETELMKQYEASRGTVRKSCRFTARAWICAKNSWKRCFLFLKRKKY